MNLDGYAKHQARKLIAAGCFCGDCLTSIVKEICADQKRWASEAINRIDNIRGASQWPVIYKQDALKAVMESTPTPEAKDEQGEQR